MEDIGIKILESINELKTYIGERTDALENRMDALEGDYRQQARGS